MSTLPRCGLYVIVLFSFGLSACSFPQDHKGNQTNADEATHAPKTVFKRTAFGNWIDADRDCLNTRAEVLKKLSTSTVEMTDSECSVERGRWLDPYTGQTFYQARDMDIDHLVPLKWAWERGADLWSAEQRKQFANDEANLFAVQARANRSKGAKSPLEWLPPDSAFHCQYVVRFIRLSKQYQLTLSPQESQAYSSLKTHVCG